jgi:outer membrane lipoprotein-sorting protein
MRHFRRQVLFELSVFTLLAGAFSPRAAPSSPSPEELLDQVDDLYRSQSSQATLQMTIVTERYQRSLTLESTTKGEENSLVRILKPEKEAGIATLRVGKNLWNYLPNVDRTMRVPIGMMSSSWMGSHFSHDDVVRESRFADDYELRFLESTSGQSASEYVIEAVPRPASPVVWGKVIIRIAENRLPIEAQFFDEKNRRVRTITWQNPRSEGGRIIPTTMRLEPSDKPGQFTEIKILHIEFDVPIPDQTFTLRTLR